MFVVSTQPPFRSLKDLQGMWAVNGHSALIGGTTSNKQTHLFGLSTHVIAYAWVTARKSFTAYFSKTYVRQYRFFGVSYATRIIALEVGRGILTCLCQQTGYTRLYDGQRDRAGKFRYLAWRRALLADEGSPSKGVGSSGDQVPSVEYHPVQRSNRIQPYGGFKLGCWGSCQSALL